VIKRYLERKRRLIDKELDRYLPKRTTPPRIIHEAMRYSVLNGGKRIRPILLLEATRVCGGRPKAALPYACAVELVHSYSLIHDDLPSMDNADMRRGKPSCHIKYGEALAILAGDSLLSLAFNLIARGKNEAGTSQVTYEISKAIGSFGMIGGQVMDLKIRQQKKIDLPTMEYINLHKTASLIAASTKIGSIIAQAPEREVRLLQKYGEYVGLAFQIIDDILDRDGYVNIFGISGARDEAEKLTDRAKDILKPFGGKADILWQIADFVLNRRE